MSAVVDASYRNPNARARGVAVLLVQAVVSAGVGYWVFMQTFRVAGCGSSCNFAVAEGAWHAQIWVSIVTFIASIVTIVWSWYRGRESWWIVAIGVALILVSGVVATIAIVVATATAL